MIIHTAHFNTHIKFRIFIEIHESIVFSYTAGVANKSVLKLRCYCRSHLAGSIYPVSFRTFVYIAIPVCDNVLENRKAFNTLCIEAPSSTVLFVVVLFFIFFFSFSSKFERSSVWLSMIQPKQNQYANSFSFIQFILFLVNE